MFFTVILAIACSGVCTVWALGIADISSEAGIMTGFAALFLWVVIGKVQSQYHVEKAYQPQGSTFAPWIVIIGVVVGGGYIAFKSLDLGQSVAVWIAGIVVFFILVSQLIFPKTARGSKGEAIATVADPGVIRGGATRAFAILLLIVAVLVAIVASN